MKFPKRVKRHGKTYATIYGRTPSYPSYRVAWSVNGKRRMKAFDRFGGKDGALQYAEGLAKDLAKGSQSTALTSAQASDALAALERLQSLYASTGKRVSLLAAVSEFADASGKLNGFTVREAVEGFLRNSASVQRRNIAEAVEAFIAAEDARTKAKPGERAQLAAKYAYNRALQLRRFAATFPNTALCDLTKEHLNALFSAKPLSEFSAKSRNHHRAAIRQFLAWAVRNDFLSSVHRLAEADAMRPEHANTEEVQLYSPKELRALLEAADGPMRAFIAIGALAGLRTAEILRLDWADVWRVPGHIEIGKTKSKTRQRRLAEICPALAAWLEPYRQSSGKLWAGDPALTAKRNENLLHKRLNAVCESAGVGRKENALRHSFCTYHFALHSNENLTAAQAGNAPAVVHRHYRALATKAEAEKWFAIAPATPANIVPLGVAQER